MNAWLAGLREANPGYERTLFETANLTGAREGELLALRRPDLELPKEGAGKMVIRLSLSWARPQGEEVVRSGEVLAGTDSW